MSEQNQTYLGKTRVHFKALPFEPDEKLIIYYDPNPDSEFSEYIETHLQDVKEFFADFNFEFCYFPEIFTKLTPEQVRYRFPNWNGEPLKKMGSDLLKPYLAPEDRDIGACFLRLFDMRDGSTFSCYQLEDFSTKKWEDQFAYYKRGLQKSMEYDKNENSIRFSVVSDDKGKYQRRIVFDIEEDFEKESEKVMEELKDFLKSVRLNGINKFVLDCSVPIESRLSRLVVDENYNIILPDYSNMIIKMDIMPKAVFLLFLRHEEGINFKYMADYRNELERYYKALTTRFAQKIVDGRIDAVVDPLRNALNEKCSRIREAFLKQMDESLADNYCITGHRGEVKRIILPRHLVEWRCEL